MMSQITSRQNPKIKQVRALRQRKQRDAQKLFVVEGIRHVGEAVDSGISLEFLIYSPELLTSGYAHDMIQKVSLAQTPCFTTSPEIFSSISNKENPQGILAVAQQNLNTLENLNRDTFPWGTAVVSPQDPGNLGTILRTIDSVGADGLIVLENSVDIFHPTTVRASMGALFWKPVVYTSFDKFASWSKEHRYHIFGASAKGETFYTEVKYRSPAILLLGSERQGLSAEQTDLCNTVIQLPMKGRSTSLNLSVAAGILLYEMGKQLLKFEEL